MSSEKFRMLTPSERSKLKDCQLDRGATCNIDPKEVCFEECLRCCITGLKSSLMRENIGSAMGYVYTLQKLLEEKKLLKWDS